MWGAIEKPAQHIAKYSTLLGQTWYLLLFVFRLIVVATIAAEAYKDEQSNFHCSTKVVGCESVCYNRFAKISHIRFWAFQILALATPVIIFHFYSIFVEGRIQKLEDAQEKLKKKLIKDEKLGSSDSHSSVHEEVKKRLKKVGKIKKRPRFHENKMHMVQFTNSIYVAYYFSVIFRLFFEFLFLYLAFDLFTFAVYQTELYDGVVISQMGRVNNFFDLFWLKVPQLYRCSGSAVRWACNQHMLPGNRNAYIPCWVSRPWEKTIILRYMNVLSLVGLLLCFAELLQLTVKFCKSYHRSRRRSSSNDYLPAPSDDSSEVSEKSLKPINFDVSVQNVCETGEKPAEQPIKYATLPRESKPKRLESLPEIKPKRSRFEDIAQQRKKKELELAGLIRDREEMAQREAIPVQVRLRKSSKKKSSQEKLIDETELDGVGTGVETKPKLPKFDRFLASGSQSFHKSSKRKYKRRFGESHNLEDESFTPEDDDDDDDEEDSDSSGSTERVSVSIHSSNLGLD